MSKRSITVIKRSFLPLAPLATLAMGGCSVLGLGQHHVSSPMADAAPAPANVAQPATAKDDLNPDAEKSILAFADRLAKAEKSDRDSQAQVVLASDQHLADATPPDTTAGSSKPIAVEPVTVASVRPVAPVLSVGVKTTDSNPPIAGAVASLTLDPHDSGPSISAMGAMNTSALPAASTLTTNAPSISDANIATTGSEPSVDAVLDMLRKRVQARPQQLNYSLALALLESAEMRKTDDPVLTALTPSDQKLVADLAGAVEAISAQPVSAATTLSDRAGPLLNASQKWQSDADLKLPRLTLATRVDSFGVYTPIEPRFEYGKRHTVIIYCEVANFTAKRDDDGWYETVLSQQDTLTTDDGLLVWRPNPEDAQDRSMNQRKDFYLVKKLTLPENLAIGKYTLKMSVTDKLAKKRAEVTMPIEIVGK